MTETQSPDRRLRARIPCRVPVLLRTSDGRDVHATCIDVNASGIAAESDQVLAVGQRVRLLLEKKSGEVKPVPMLVIYRMGQTYGMSALDAFEDLLELIPMQG